MTYRVCIPCAGLGSRLGPITKFINKSLVSINNRPVLSHIIDKFPSDTEFVVPLGYKGNLIRQFLSAAYPDNIFHFVEVSPFEGDRSRSGPNFAFLQKLFTATICFHCV